MNSVDTRNVPASNFMATMAANVNNEKLSDDQFREFIRNTLPIVQKEPIPNDTIRKVVVMLLNSRNLMIETREKSHATVDDVLDAIGVMNHE